MLFPYTNPLKGRSQWKKESVSRSVVSDSWTTLWTLARQVPPSLGFSRQESWEWVAISSSRRSSWPRDRTWVSCIAGRFFTIWAGIYFFHPSMHHFQKKKCHLFRGFSSVQSLSRVRLFATPWIVARQASLSITNSQSLPKFMSIELMMPSSHLILCHPLLLLPPIPPSIRVFSNKSTLRMRWPKYWSSSFSISPSNEHPGLIFYLYLTEIPPTSQKQCQYMERRNDTLISCQLQPLRVMHGNTAATFAYLLNPFRILVRLKTQWKVPWVN